MTHASTSTLLTAKRRCAVALASTLALMAGAKTVCAEEFAVRAEIAAAQGAIDRVFQNMPGMAGLGVIPEQDLGPIQELAAEAERNLRTARRRAQTMSSIHDQAWAVAHARAAKSFADSADDLRRILRH